MKKTFKKAVAVVLTMAMAMSVGVPAFAAENSIEPYAHDVEYKREIVDSDTVWIEHILVSGQPLSGTCVDGKLYCNPYGGMETTMEVSFSFKTVSISITPGTFSNTITAVGANTIPGKYCLLYLDKEYICNKYALYERLTSSSEWRFIGYDYGTVLNRVHAYCEEV